jgi:hypothetical protein
MEELRPAQVRPIKLRVMFNDGSLMQVFECHFWTCGERDLDLFRVREGRLEQFAAIGHVMRVEEI